MLGLSGVGRHHNVQARSLSLCLALLEQVGVLEAIARRRGSIPLRVDSSETSWGHVKAAINSPPNTYQNAPNGPRTCVILTGLNQQALMR